MVGNYQPLHELGKADTGVKFNDNSYLFIDNVDFNQSDSAIQSALFYLGFEYQEPLPEVYHLVTRGSKGQRGFLDVSLKQVAGGRVLVIDAEDKENAVLPSVYQSQSVFKPNEKHMVMFGVAQDVGNTLRAVYVDSLGGYYFDPIKQNAFFDFKPLPIYAFRNNPSFQGSLDANRLMIFDSSSTALNYYNVHNLVGFTLVDLEQTVPRNQFCKYASIYGNDSNCPECVSEAAILIGNGLCSPYCPLGSFNNNGICQACVENEQRDSHIDYCGEYQHTYWTYVPVDRNTFKMVPSRRILTPFIDYPNIFLLSIAGRPDSKKLLEYTVRPNYDSQEVFFDVKYLDYLKGERYRIDV